MADSQNSGDPLTGDTHSRVNNTGVNSAGVNNAGAEGVGARGAAKGTGARGLGTDRLGVDNPGADRDSASVTGASVKGFSASSVPAGRRTDEWSECLVLIAGKRDRAAYTRLFRHFAPLIKAFALSGSALSATHADELVQEVMLKIWQKAAAFNPEKAAASTWVYTIARNCRTDMFRRLQKFDTPLAAEDFTPEQSDEEPFLQLQNRRNADRIREMMVNLPVDQTQILAKVYMEGKSHAEAAAELDLPLGTVKSRVRLAVQKLQIQFERNRNIDLHT